VVSGYWALRPRALQPLVCVLLLEPTHWIMQTRQFANLKRRIEGAPGVAPRPGEAASAAPIR